MNVNFTDNRKMVKAELEKSIERVLEKIGIQAEGYAKIELTESGAVDTGRLRNSISHATHTNVKSKNYSWRDSTKGTSAQAGTDSTNPRSTPKEHSVVIGTNVTYAPVIEFGGHGQAPRPYLKPAIRDHLDEYKQMIKEEMRK